MNENNGRAVLALRDLADELERSPVGVIGERINHALSLTSGGSDADRLLTLLLDGVNARNMSTMGLRRRKAAEERTFTGNCPVRQHTADGAYVGRCWYSTYNGRCDLHGDVSRFLAPDANLAEADDRPIERP